MYAEFELLHRPHQLWKSIVPHMTLHSLEIRLRNLHLEIIFTCLAADHGEARSNLRTVAGNYDY